MNYYTFFRLLQIILGLDLDYSIDNYGGYYGN